MRFTPGLMIALSALLAGCVATKPQVKVDQTEAFTLSAAQIDKVKKGVLSTLKDPYSAHFGSIKAAKLALSSPDKTANGYVVCGEINSKNSYGGYVGMTPFVGGFKTDLQDFTLLSLGDQLGGSSDIVKACQQSGIVL